MAAINIPFCKLTENKVNDFDKFIDSNAKYFCDDVKKLPNEIRDFFQGAMQRTQNPFERFSDFRFDYMENIFQKYKKTIKMLKDSNSAELDGIVKMYEKSMENLIEPSTLNAFVKQLIDCLVVIIRKSFYWRHMIVIFKHFPDRYGRKVFDFQAKVLIEIARKNLSNIPGVDRIDDFNNFITNTFAKMLLNANKIHKNLQTDLIEFFEKHATVRL